MQHEDDTLTALLDDHEAAARTPPPPVPAITATRGAVPADDVVVARVPSRPVTSATPR